MDLSDIKTIFENGDIEKAEEFLVFYSGEKDVDYWLLRGSINQKRQLWGNAINDFQKVLEIDAGNKEAETRLAIVKNILDFWNQSMFDV